MTSWPHYDEEQIAAVAEILRSGRVNYWTGEEVKRFEEEYAQTLGRRFGIALANGTVALELALRALEIGPGDEVVVTPRSFIASASAAVLLGATPVFADVDADSQNITAETVAAVVTPRTKAVIAVHLAGWPCEMAPLMSLAGNRGLKVVEDCAQAHGARYHGRPVGSFGDVAVFSFCQDKIMTTGGEGGLLATDDERLWLRAWSFKEHGKDFNAVNRADPTPAFKWLHHDLGSNYRMTAVQAALGRVQLRRLDGWVEQRGRNAKILVEAFREAAALRAPQPPAHVKHAQYRCYVFVRPERLRPGWTRDRILAAARAAGAACFSGSCPEIYLEAAFQRRGLSPAERLPVARTLGETSLAFLADPCQYEGGMARTADAVLRVLEQASQ